MTTEMKTLLQNWRNYSETPVETPFLSLLREHNDKKMSDQQLFLEWKEQTTAELQALDEINWEKEAELTADPNYKPPHERPGMLSKGWEAANDFLLKKSIELIELGKRSFGAALSALSWLNKQIDRFREKHPMLYNVVKALLIALFLYLLYELTTGEAQASIKNPDGSVMSDIDYNAARGMISDWGQSGEFTEDKFFDSGKMLGMLEKMHTSELEYDIDQVSKVLPKGVAQEIADTLQMAVKKYWSILDRYKKATPGSQDREFWSELLVKWYNIGKKIKVS